MCSSPKNPEVVVDCIGIVSGNKFREVATQSECSVKVSCEFDAVTTKPASRWKAYKFICITYEDYQMDGYYEGYELNDYIQEWMLSDKGKLVLSCGLRIVEYRESIRQCSKEMMLSKSTVHRYIKQELPQISYELYKCVLRQLVINKKKYFKAS